MKKYFFPLFLLVFFLAGCAGGGLYKESRENIPCILGSGGSLYFHIPVKAHEYVVSAVREEFSNRGIDVSPILSRSGDLWVGYFSGLPTQTGENILSMGSGGTGSFSRIVASGKFSKGSFGAALGMASGWKKIKDKDSGLDYYTLKEGDKITAAVPESGLIIATTEESRAFPGLIENYFNPPDIFSPLFLQEGLGDSIGIYFPGDNITRFFLGNLAGGISLPVDGVEIYLRPGQTEGVYQIEMRFIPVERNMVRGLQALVKIFIRNCFGDSGLNMDIGSSDIYVRGLTMKQEDVAELVLAMF